MKSFADVCRLILDIWLKGLVIEADDNVPAIAVPKGKYSTNEFRNSIRLVSGDPAFDLHVQALGGARNEVFDTRLINIHRPIVLLSFYW